MFKGPSETLKTEDLVCQPVALIDPRKSRDILEGEVRDRKLAALLWPDSDSSWHVLPARVFLNSDKRTKIEDLAVKGFPVKINADAREAIALICSFPGKIGVAVDEEGLPCGIMEAGYMLSIVWERLLHMECSVGTLMDTVNEAITVIDQQNVVVGWNRRAEELYHIPAGTIIGEEINRFFSSLVVTHVISKDAMKKNGVRDDYHQPIPGTHVLINALPIIYQDRVLGSVCSERDITETVSLHNQLSKANSEVQQLKHEITKIHGPNQAFQKILGHSKKLQDTINLAKRVANTNVSVLLRGESGTGKELFAEAIHHESSRRDNPFVVINCGAIPANLIESELFGYQAGAFTGADRKGRPGKFELAHLGTVFLDEIGEMPLDLQVKILRVLQNKQFYKVGGNDPIEVDVRVIAATHRDLEQMIQDGLFREDLYYRINVMSLEVPPLRQRKEDIPELIYLFIREFCLQQNRELVQITPEVMTALLNYSWPGNIRELRNVVERMVILADDNMVLLDHLPSSIKTGINSSEEMEMKETENVSSSLAEITNRTEREIILQAIRKSGGDKSKAAKRLGIPRSTLYYKMKKLDIH